MRCNTFFWPALLFLSLPALAQLIPAGQPVPRTAKPPVIFVNGYQTLCGSGSTFESTFGIADQVLQANGEVSVFFDNCSVPDKPSIEKLGAAFGAFLAGLKYTDGTPVGVVDVVAHSMGGLIVRSYLSGKQDQVSAFAPPGTTETRKLIFLATPQFGTPLANLPLGQVQLDELSSGSNFLWDLNTWTDNTDDLRGVDAIAVIGSGGTGELSGSQPGFDDGVVTLTSASLGFYQPGRTRVLPVCHVEAGGLVTLVQLCPDNAKGVARIHSASDDSARIIVSFLNGTGEWKSIGQAAEENNLLANAGGLYARPFSGTGDPMKLNSGTVTGQGTSKNLQQSNDQIGFLDFFPAGQVTLSLDTSAGTMTRTTTLRRATDQAITVKPGPIVNRVLTAAAALFPYTFAPRSIVSIYGESLAAGTVTAGTLPLPTMLSDAQVLAGDTALPLFYVSALQINAALPDNVSGLVKLTVKNGSGAHTVNLLIEPARPAIFTTNGVGTGLAAAIRWNNGGAVSASNPLRAGDFVELFVSGLGALTASGNANQIPTVTLVGANCPVTYAGAAPGFTGLDQINCQIPGGLGANPAATLTVSAGGRTSNPATLVLE